MTYTITGVLRHYYDPDKPVFLYNNDHHTQAQRITKRVLSSESTIQVRSESASRADEMATVFKHLGMVDVEVVST